MKIVGFTLVENEVKMVLKSDSSLMVNRKPFFIPDWSEDIRYVPCVNILLLNLLADIMMP